MEVTVDIGELNEIISNIPVGELRDKLERARFAYENRSQE
jgi:hypothetical protein